MIVKRLLFLSGAAVFYFPSNPEPPTYPNPYLETLRLSHSQTSYPASHTPNLGTF